MSVWNVWLPDPRQGAMPAKAAACGACGLGCSRPLAPGPPALGQPINICVYAGRPWMCASPQQSEGQLINRMRSSQTRRRERRVIHARTKGAGPDVRQQLNVARGDDLDLI